MDTLYGVWPVEMVEEKTITKKENSDLPSVENSNVNEKISRDILSNDESQIDYYENITKWAHVTCHMVLFL